MSKKDDTNKVRSDGYYRFFPGDYHKDTAGLSLVEHGAYRLLLDSYFSEEGLLSDRDRLYRTCRVTTPEEKKAVDYVVRKFFREEDDRLINNRAERELIARRVFLAEQKRKSVLGVQAKKGYKKTPVKMPVGIPPDQPTGEPGGLPKALGQPGVQPGVNPSIGICIEGRCQDLTATGAALTAAPEDEPEDQDPGYCDVIGRPLKRHTGTEEEPDDWGQDIVPFLAEVKAGTRTPKDARDNVISRGATPSFALELFPDKVEVGR